MRRRLEGVRIMLFATFAAIVFGIVHDQVTAHVCVEYFTLAHPPVFPTRSPFLLAIGWGVIATWWVGLPLGLLLAGAARLGRAPKLALVDIRPPLVALMIATFLGAMAMGTLGAWLVLSGRAEVPEPWGAVLPRAKHAPFAFDVWAHATSYAIGALGGLFVIGRTAWKRHGRVEESATA